MTASLTKSWMIKKHTPRQVCDVTSWKEEMKVEDLPWECSIFSISTDIEGFRNAGRHFFLSACTSYLRVHLLCHRLCCCHPLLTSEPNFCIYSNAPGILQTSCVLSRLLGHPASWAQQLPQLHPFLLTATVGWSSSSHVSQSGKSSL